MTALLRHGVNLAKELCSPFFYQTGKRLLMENLCYHKIYNVQFYYLTEKNHWILSATMNMKAIFYRKKLPATLKKNEYDLE